MRGTRKEKKSGENVKEEVKEEKREEEQTDSRRMKDEMND